MRFEVAIPGIPRAYRAASCPAWQAHVRGVAARAWPAAHAPYQDELSIVLIYFHLGTTTIDLDNMAKPILDALNGLVYADDRQLSQMTVRKTQLTSPAVVRSPSAPLTAALVLAWESRSGFVYLAVRDAPDHGAIP
jgi:Holliday junction resolvase RusA-like endonuclease